MRRLLSNGAAARRGWLLQVTSILLVCALHGSPASRLAAQGLTTAAIRGAVTAAGTEARVHVIHGETGFAVTTSSRQGRFLVHGLHPGGPYSVTVSAIGFAPQRREQIFLALGEMLELDFILEPLIAALDTVRVIAGRAAYAPVHTHGGTGMTFSDSLLRALPTLNRDLYDFVRLVPQISTKISLPNTAFSAAGAGFRFNDFLVNGVSERTLGGNVSNAFAGLKSVPLEAVQEYQVLIAPYDVRYGDFAGALVNTVTKSGSNVLRGSAFAYVRNDRLARSGSAGRYDRVQYGLSLGGSLVRDRLHFFVAPELQRFAFPAAGPYVGQAADAERALPVSAADLARLDAIMEGYGLVPGSAGKVENGNPLRNLFSRLDLALPRWNSRAAVWSNYSGSDDVVFSRAALDTFSLSSSQVTRVAITRATALQFHTNLARAGGGHNELLLSVRRDYFAPMGAVQQPIVRISLPGTAGGEVIVNSGTHESAQAFRIRLSAVALKNNLTLALGGAHVLTAGVEVESFRIRRMGMPGSYGTWTFASLDDFEQGTANRYELGVDFGSGSVPLSGAQYAAYVGDQWQATRTLSVTSGLRADLLAVDGHPPYNPAVDSIFARRTDRMPRHRVEWSPRVGFIWDVSGVERRHLRGGVGLFVSRFPLAWVHTALMSHGTGGGLLRCGAFPSDLGPPPTFVPDYQAAPTACANGVTLAASQRGDVDLLDPTLRMTRALRGSLAYDVRLGDGLRLTTEAVATRMLSDFVFVNLNLSEPVSVDRNGRVMYGSIAPSGVATPTLRSAFSEVIDLRNTSRNHSYQLSTRVEKALTARSTAMLSYTYSRVRDAQTPLRVQTRGTAAWAVARVVSGRHDDFSPGTSAHDIPHRVVLAGTYRLPVRPHPEISFYYVGESGRPFTYLAYGALRRGDLNADGSNVNDPIYVPLTAMDANEILFSGVSAMPGADTSAAAQAERIRLQQAAFEDFISSTACLRRQRGRILQRNSCREPWSNTTVASLRQKLPFGGRTLEAQLDVFNVLNLASSRWGLRREAVPRLLEHVTQATGPVESSQPIFRFNPAAAQWTTVAVESGFQLQAALRYRF